MSVMACDRKDCTNIMCDRMILDSTAHICDSCFSELLEYKESWTGEMSASEVRDKIEKFMQAKPGTMFVKKLSQDEINAVFNRLTS